MLSTPSRSRALDCGDNLPHVPLRYWCIDTIKEFGCPASRVFQPNPTDAFAEFESSFKLPINPFPPRCSVANQANDNGTVPDLFTDASFDVGALQTVDRRTHASIVEVDRRIWAVGHKAETIHLRPIFSMEAEEKTSLRCMF